MESFRALSAITSVFSIITSVFGLTAPFNGIPPTWYIKMTSRRFVVPMYIGQLSIPASVVTNDAADEDAFVRVDDEPDAGFPESKRMRTAAFVGAVAGEDFG